MRIGAHVSIAGGIQHAPENAHKLGCEVFQMFTRSPRGGPAVPLTDAATDEFLATAEKTGQGAWVVHTPYYINFASANPRIRHGSITVVREELERASQLHAAFLMTHLGSSRDVSQTQAQGMVVEALGKVLAGYDGTTVFCIEIAAGSGDILGSRFEEIGEYIRQVESKFPKLKHRVGVCFDTCHALASGYDLRSAAAVKQTLTEFDRCIGIRRLRLVHANDSKFDLGSHRDRHEHIGRGKIGRDGFKAMLRHEVLRELDWYLETEPDGLKQDLVTIKDLR